MAALASSMGGITASADAKLANRCLALEAKANGRFVAIRGDAYRADEHARRQAAAFYAKPTGLGTYLLQDQEGKLLAVEAAATGRASEPGASAEWAVRRSRKRSFAITSTAGRQGLAVEPATGELILIPAGSRGRRGRFGFRPKRGCRPFPEAAVGAAGKPFAGTRRDGTVFGFSDAHVHITADMRAGGRVIHGESFDRFGITRALGGDEADHGPNGSLDVTGNLLRTGSPVGTHDPQGWPTFAGWPVHDTYTHQQTYYVWLKQMWKAGLRLVVAQTVEDEPLCRLEPIASHSCDETETIKLEIQRLRALQDYVDAQAGGAGRGWFRIVTSPRQARRVIERGKLAVVIGIESSDPFGCSEFEGEPQCTRADIDRGLEEFHNLGVRGLFIAHWIDNALAGAAFEGGAKGDFISSFELLQTGHPFASAPCTDADEAGGQCNTKGLTELGRYLVQRMMEKHMLIEVDHLSQKARASVLAIAEANRYPLISSHTGTGGEWTREQLGRLYALGGLASATSDTAPQLAAKILELRRSKSRKHYFGVGLGTDTGGFNALPGPRADAAANPLHYPFKAYLCKLRFVRQRTGERVYDLNTDGVAHYGLFADLIADMQRQPGGQRAMRPLFRSAEAYLRMWRLAYRRP